MKPVKIPLIYAYIYRNIKKRANGNGFILDKNLKEAVRRVIFNCPTFVLAEVLKEFEEMGLVSCMTASKRYKYYRVLESSACNKQLKRLREYVFPLSPQ